MSSHKATDNLRTIAQSKMKERLEEPIQWFPFPAIIGFMLVLVLSGHLLPGLNPRLGVPVDVLPYPAKETVDGGIWLGIYERDGYINAVSSDRRTFRWKITETRPEAIVELVQYLKERRQAIGRAAALKLESKAYQSTATIAVDQHLSYLHLKPVIYALAEAGVGRYGFETKVIN